MKELCRFCISVDFCQFDSALTTAKKLDGQAGEVLKNEGFIKSCKQYDEVVRKHGVKLRQYHQRNRSNHPITRGV